MLERGPSIDFLPLCAGTFPRTAFLSFATFLFLLRFLLFPASRLGLFLRRGDASQARVLPARCPQGTVRTGTATQARPVFRAPHNSSDEQDVDPPLACAVDERYAAQATLRPARGADTQPRTPPQPGIPDSHTTTAQAPSPTTAAPHCLLAPFCYDASPTSHVCASLNPPSIHVRSPYQLTSASSGSRSVKMIHADS